MQIPNELLVQLQARFNKANIEQEWQNLSKEEKTKEINYCIDRCYASLYEYEEKYTYYKRQITMLNKLSKTINKI